MVEKINTLVVDDDFAVREDCRRILTKQDYTVTTAITVFEAFDKMANQSFDVVLLDLEIAGTSMLSTISKIRELLPEAEVIVTISYPSIDIVKDVVRRGASECIYKPVNLATVTETIAGMAERKGWLLSMCY